MSQAGILRVDESILPPDVPLIFEGDTGPGAVAAFNIMRIIGGVGASVDTTSNVITINVASMGFTWNVVTSADNPVNMAPENGYIAKGAGSVHFMLPAGAAIGDTFRIIGIGNLWTISQNAGQTIIVGKLTTTAGVGGSVAATMVSDGMELVTTTTNLEFYETSMQGNPVII